MAKTDVRYAIDARLVSYIHGGTSRYTLSLVNAMAGLGEAGSLLILESRSPAARSAWPAGVRRARLFTPPHHRLEQVTLPLELRRLGPDLLHSPDFIPPFFRSCHSVITIHDLAFMRYPGLLTSESARYYGQVRRAAESADQVIAVSEATRQDVVELLGADPRKVSVVYEAAGEDCVPLDPAAVEQHRVKLGLPERFVLFVGTLEPRKNLPVLLKAYSRVWREQRIPLVVVGKNGWLYEEVFRTRDSLGLADGVRFVGPATGEQLVYYYNAAECLVLPSLYEGFGLPALEAMACGTPVVASNVSSLPEVAGDAGILIDPSDPSGLADAICRVISDEELRAGLSEKGLRRAAAFSWNRAAAETLAIYRKALGRN